MIIGISQLIFIQLVLHESKDMILSDFLSQQKNNDSDPSEKYQFPSMHIQFWKKIEKLMYAKMKKNS